MMTVELLPADEHNQRTINQSHPPNWQNPPGGDYDRCALRRRQLRRIDNEVNEPTNY